MLFAQLYFMEKCFICPPQIWDIEPKTVASCNWFGFWIGLFLNEKFKQKL